MEYLKEVGYERYYAVPKDWTHEGYGIKTITVDLVAGNEVQLSDTSGPWEKNEHEQIDREEFLEALDRARDDVDRFLGRLND